MNENALGITIREAFDRCTRLMHRKGQEYSPGHDRLENFKEAAQADSISPEEALWGMLRKHLTSLSMMCREITSFPGSTCHATQGLWEEKLTDSHNYLFLLEALLKERYGWIGPEGRE